MSFLTQPISITNLLGFNPQRKFADIEVDVIINENATDVLTITKQPVQQGASISDHAFKEPTVLSMSIYFKAGFFTSLSEIYEKLLELQVSRLPFDVITPKRVYRNMLMSTLAQTTDKNTENTLSINVTFQEVIIVNVSTTQVARTKQKFSGATGKTENAGKKQSFLYTGGQAIGVR